MQNSKLLKISWMTLSVLIVVGLVICVKSIISPPYMKDIYENYMSQSWSDFLQQQPKQAALYGHLLRLEMCMEFMAFIYALFITLAAYRKGKKWAWAALMTANILRWGSLIVFSSIFSDSNGITVGVISLCVVLVLLLLPVKEIWGAKAEQPA